MANITYTPPTIDPVTIPSISSEAPSMLQQAIEHYQPGGKFAGIRGEQLEAKRGTYTARAESQLVGRGLAGTTVGAAIPGAFEQEVATPWRTETEMFRGARLMEAVLAQAGFTERATAREQEVAIANAQMNLQRQLAERQISAQEYSTAMQSLASRSSGGGEGGASERMIANWEREWAERNRGDIGAGAGGGAGAGTGTGYVSGLLGSLEGGGGGTGSPYAEQLAAGEKSLADWLGEGYTYYGPGGQYIEGGKGDLESSGAYTSENIAFAKAKGIPLSSMAPQSRGWTGQLAGVAKQWLTEPSVARGPL